jgi:hypothetical protein
VAGVALGVIEGGVVLAGVPPVAVTVGEGVGEGVGAGEGGGEDEGGNRVKVAVRVMEGDSAPVVVHEGVPVGDTVAVGEAVVVGVGEGEAINVPVAVSVPAELAVPSGGELAEGAAEEEALSTVEGVGCSVPGAEAEALGAAVGVSSSAPGAEEEAEGLGGAGVGEAGTEAVRSGEMEGALLRVAVAEGREVAVAEKVGGVMDTKISPLQA